MSRIWKGNKMKRKTSKQLRKETRKKLKAIGRRSRKFAHLICNKCKREMKIRINLDHLDLYNDELRKSYICLFCKK